MQVFNAVVWLLVSTLMGEFSGGSRPSAKEGARLTMNVEFWEDNSGTISENIRWGPGPPGPLLELAHK